MTPQTAAECLGVAKTLIKPPDAWLKGVLARNAAGKSVTPHDPAAVAWCAVGAIRCADGPKAEIALNYMHKIVPTLVFFNNAPNTTHEMILAKFDEAIALAEKEAA